MEHKTEYVQHDFCKILEWNAIKFLVSNYSVLSLQLIYSKVQEEKEKCI